jgi:hypothetical protein
MRTRLTVYRLCRVRGADFEWHLNSHSLAAMRPGQDFTPRIHISPADFAVITNNGAMCDERGQLGLKEFEVLPSPPARTHMPRPG